MQRESCVVWAAVLRVSYVLRACRSLEEPRATSRKQMKEKKNRLKKLRGKKKSEAAGTK